MKEYDREGYQEKLLRAIIAMRGTSRSFKEAFGREINLVLVDKIEWDKVGEILEKLCE